MPRGEYADDRQRSQSPAPVPGGSRQKRGDKQIAADVDGIDGSSAAKKNRHTKITKNATAFNRAEEKEEEMFMELNAVRSQVESALAKKHPDVARKRQQSMAEKKRPGRGAASKKSAHSNDKTVRLSAPYTEQQVRQLMEDFCKPTEQRPKLAREDLEELLINFEKAYAKQNPEALGTMQVPKDGKLVVVGDTHGQLNDLLWIFVSQGLPSSQTYYLFNGDIADRGSNAIEIYVIVFLFFFLHPAAMLINRGNHEDLFMNQIPKSGGGGFFDEVLAAYDYAIYTLFTDIFKRLPLASVVNNEVFVVHGGLPRINGFSLEYIKSLPWTEYTTPSPESTDMKSMVFLDMLWSDPVETIGKFPSRRGAGIQWGVDVSASFLRSNKLKMIIRSHQCPADNHGYYVHHQGLCLTVFSASNYCGEVGNWGATVSFQGSTWPQYTIAEYWAPGFDEIQPELAKLESPLQSSGAQAIEDMSREKAQSGMTCGELGLSQATLQKMVVHLVQQKPDLWTNFTAADDQQSTKVTLKTAIGILDKVCGRTLPWKDALDYWGAIEGLRKGAPVDEANPSLSLDYDEFLSRFRVELGANFQAWKFQAVRDAYINIVSKDNEIHKMIAMFDKDKDGKVSKQEFQEILTEAGVNLSRPQMETLMRHVGFQHKAGGDKIDANDFINRFALTFKTDDTMAGHGVEKDQWASLALERLGRHMLKIPRGTAKNHKSWRQAMFGDSKQLGDKPSTALFEIFKKFDSDGNGTLSTSEFVTGIRGLPDLEEVLVEGHPLTDQDIERIARYIDQSGDGSLNYLEFIKAFNFEDKYGDVLNNQLFEDITTTLFRNRNALLCGCQFFDYEGHAKVTHEQFEDVLEALSSVLKKPEMPFTPSQIARVASAATDNNEEVKYMDFVNSFELFDSFQADKQSQTVARCLLRHETLEQAANDVEKSQRR